MNIGKRIIQKARELLLTEEKGLRYSILVRRVKEGLPDVNLGTIHGNIWNLETRLPEEIYKPARGVFRHVRFKETEPTEVSIIPEPTLIKIAEEQFYEPFADWIVNELEECTRAISLGGNIFRDRWGTPDIVGIRKPAESDIIKPPIEVISAELKLDTGGLITAFGQACSYKLFSHKSYIVIPSQSSEDDIARLDALGLFSESGSSYSTPVTPPSPTLRFECEHHDQNQTCSM